MYLAVQNTVYMMYITFSILFICRVNRVSTINDVEFEMHVGIHGLVLSLEYVPPK